MCDKVGHRPWRTEQASGGRGSTTTSKNLTPHKMWGIIIQSAWSGHLLFENRKACALHSIMLPDMNWRASSNVSANNCYSLPFLHLHRQSACISAFAIQKSFTATKLTAMIPTFIPNTRQSFRESKTVSEVPIWIIHCRVTASVLSTVRRKFCSNFGSNSGVPWM